MKSSSVLSEAGGERADQEAAVVMFVFEALLVGDRFPLAFRFIVGACVRRSCIAI